MLTNSDWRAIEEFVNRMTSKIGEPFVQAIVLKTDAARRVIFVKEFGDTPIPIIGLDYQVKYSYKEPSGATTIKKTKAHSEEVEILVPRVGETVLIAQHFGSKRLPKCLGVIKSKRFIETDGD
jgi:hypothetical protein